MGHYVVKFYKKLVNDEGREFDTCQGTIETLAANKPEAAQLAKQRFCEAGNLHDWSIHADRFEVSEADFPS